MRLEDLSITELSRLVKKSRPTVYKYVTDYKRKNFDNIPNSVKELFDRIEAGCAKSEIYAYCENNFFEKEIKGDGLRQIINLIIENEEIINLDNLKNYIIGEIENGKRADK
ncbi:MAG: hypothetical protein NC033_05570 [Clostridiales bacterium]|nr:hypothetical protein [Clostridiales bacterium]